MMRMLAFTIYDSKAECFAKPFFDVTIGSAIRSFADAVNGGEEGPWAKHPEDYTLYKCGYFDDAMGKFTTEEPESLGTAMIFKVDRFADVPMPGAVPGSLSREQLNTLGDDDS